jgi:hypothetical protein
MGTIKLRPLSNYYSPYEAALIRYFCECSFTANAFFHMPPDVLLSL